MRRAIGGNSKAGASSAPTHSRWRQMWEVKIDDRLTCLSELTERSHHVSHQCVVLSQGSSSRRQGTSLADDFGLDNHRAGTSWP